MGLCVKRERQFGAHKLREMHRVKKITWGGYVKNCRYKEMRMSLRLKAQTNKQTEFKRELRNGSLRPWKEESMYGQLIRDMPDTINKEKVYEWFRVSDLKVETEALICAAL